MIRTNKEDEDHRDFISMWNYKYFYSFPNMVHHSSSIEVGDVCVISDKSGRTTGLFECKEFGIPIGHGVSIVPKAPTVRPREKVMNISIRVALGRG